MDLPSSFIHSMSQLLSSEELKEFLKALSVDTPVSIRLNKGKPFIRPKEGWEQVPWCSMGYYLPMRPTFTFDPLFHVGAYYVQEASSMFLSQVVQTYVKEPAVALDLCAAPGGKSTLLQDNLPDGSLLIANEVMPHRAQILKENLVKWGHPSTIVSHNDSSAFSHLTHFFDFILTDVPCSGEGMFRKDEVAIEEWNLENVDACWKRQRMIVENVWPSLKPGGILVYSTCTFNTLENEQNVRWIQENLGADILDVPVLEDWKITSALGGKKIPVYRFLPHKTKGEGLFMAVLRKTSAEEPIFSGRKKEKQKKPTKNNAVSIPNICKEWIKDRDNFQFQLYKDMIIAFPKTYVEQWGILSQNLNILHAGITIGSIKGKDVIPDHCLAMSQVASDSFPREEVSYNQAISYLRKESLSLSAETPKGFVLLTYNHQPLGFVKNVGNRANNLYPQEWRIRSGFSPEQVITP